jgi:hypothetical protein
VVAGFADATREFLPLDGEGCRVVGAVQLVLPHDWLTWQLGGRWWLPPTTLRTDGAGSV